MERLILYDGLQENDILVASGYLGWRLIRDRTENDGLRQLIWKACDDKAIVYYTFDPILQVNFLDFDGDNAEEAQGQAYAGFPFYSPKRLLKVISPSDDDATAMRKLARAAIAAQTDPKPEYGEVFASGLRHPLSRVREGAAYAIAHASLRIFSNLLKEAAEQDESPEVRSMAEELLIYLEQEGL